MSWTVYEGYPVELHECNYNVACKGFRIDFGRHSTIR